MQSESIEDDGDHGGLVKKILETKKELEGTKNEQKEVRTKFFPLISVSLK